MPSSRPRSFDAIVLAGGQASRLGGVDKAALELKGRPLLHHILEKLGGGHLAGSFGGARRIVVVGPERLAALIETSPAATRVSLTQEQPAFGGPAAGIGAGMAALDEANHEVSPEFVAILTVDAPWSPAAIPDLIDALNSAATETVPRPELAVAVDGDGRIQWLTSVVRRSALQARLAEFGTLTNASARQLLASLPGIEAPLTERHADSITQDIDTPEDAARHGIDLPPPASAGHIRPPPPASAGPI